MGEDGNSGSQMVVGLESLQVTAARNCLEFDVKLTLNMFPSKMLFCLKIENTIIFALAA